MDKSPGATYARRTMSLVKQPVVIIGAGIGGLTTAALLAARGVGVVVLERAAKVGGKVRTVRSGGLDIDAGPTVLTMRWVFDEIFQELGARLDDRLTLVRAERLARHTWASGGELDLYADVDRTAAAIEAFAGRAEADGYRRFCAYAERIHCTVQEPFLRGERPSFRSALGLAKRFSLADAIAIDGHRSQWKAIASFFRDERLRQLFGRYATYAGSSPFLAPATLNVIAHVERDGVWLVEGGMVRVAEALERLVREAGGVIRCGAEVAEITTDGARATGVRLMNGERIEAAAVVCNGDVEAIARGFFGDAAARAADRHARSLSAVTWAVTAETSGFPLVRHNVFFSTDYAAEFRDLFDRGEVPHEPTVYVCAQDRDDEGARRSTGPERLLILINAPPAGDAIRAGKTRFYDAEVDACKTRCFSLLERCNLRLRAMSDAVVTTPADFAQLFPATGGALYGPAVHGWAAPFKRAPSRTRIPGLYLTGGSAHPGAGVPMVAQSGRLAAASVVADLASTSASPRAATHGGTWTSSLMTAIARSA